MELPANEEQDVLYWGGGHPPGIYTVKTGYAFLMNNFLQQDVFSDTNFFRILWKLNIPPKWSLFLWKLVMNGLVVKSNLVKRGIDIDVYCDSCGMAEEDQQHLFRMCSFGRYAWANCSLNISSEIDESTPFGHWIQNYILLFHSEDGKRSERVGTFIGVLWSILLTRNGRIFSNQGGCLTDLFRNYNTAMQQLSVWQRVGEGVGVNGKVSADSGAPPSFERVNIGCKREDINHPTNARLEVTIMADGSWLKRNRMAGTGWAYSEDQISYMEGGGTYGKAHSSLHAEVMACVAALKWAEVKGY
ncbi:uncharacterized protein LOC110723989 [Chenopodium quinoa]|uniref:uncharacterized protein LOC110723989 n=1 Tax=Chenopodium quinoa TaxID=63459 RepID=UPI000B76CF5D|nr:uncharacterized protein LOC110723989 [Chenopodium quinoa]